MHPQANVNRFRFCIIPTPIRDFRYPLSRVQVSDFRFSIVSIVSPFNPASIMNYPDGTVTPKSKTVIPVETGIQLVGDCGFRIQPWSPDRQAIKLALFFKTRHTIYDIRNTKLALFCAIAPANWVCFAFSGMVLPSFRPKSGDWLWIGFLFSRPPRARTCIILSDISGCVHFTAGQIGFVLQKHAASHAVV